MLLPSSDGKGQVLNSAEPNLRRDVLGVDWRYYSAAPLRRISAY